MPRQFRRVIAVGKCESGAWCAQFRAYLCETVFNFRGSPFLRLACQDGVCQTVGAYGKTPSGQVPRLVPGHWQEIVRFVGGCEAIVRTGMVQAFHQEAEGKV